MAQKQAKEVIPAPQVYLGTSSLHGRGVFAAKDFAVNDLIEQSPLLSDINDASAENYVFEFQGRIYLPLGYGALYNHADEPNLQFFLDPEAGLISYTAARSIARGEELLISYGDEWWQDKNIPKLKVDPHLHHHSARFQWQDLYMIAIVVGCVLLYFKG